jgi:hypothetical protein
MKVPVWAVDTDFEAPVRLGDLPVDEGQLRFSNGEGTLSGRVPCERWRKLLTHRYGDFLGRPFALKYGGVMVSDCVLTSNNAADMKFVYIPLPPHEEVARAILAK